MTDVVCTAGTLQLDVSGMRPAGRGAGSWHACGKTPTAVASLGDLVEVAEMIALGTAEVD